MVLILHQVCSLNLLDRTRTWFERWSFKGQLCDPSLLLPHKSFGLMYIFDVLLSFEVTLKIGERNVAKNCQKTLQMFHRFLMTKFIIMVIIIVLMIMITRPAARPSLVRSCWPAWLLERALKGLPSFFRLALPSSMLLFSLSLSSAHLQLDICHDHYKVCRRLHPLPCGGEVPEEETVWRLWGIPTYSSCKPQERPSKYLNIFLFSIFWPQNWQW